MSCKSALYSANTASQAVAVGGTISFGTPVRRFGCNCRMEGGNLSLNGSGYYDIDANITFAGTAAGTAVITLYKDGTAIPGATASAVTTATSVTSVTIPAVLRNTCYCDSVITAVLSGVAVTVSSASITAEKV